jgi:hypothetical protein
LQPYRYFHIPVHRNQASSLKTGRKDTPLALKLLTTAKIKEEEIAKLTEVEALELLSRIYSGEYPSK